MSDKHETGSGSEVVMNEMVSEFLINAFISRQSWKRLYQFINCVV